ncbi:hypothetical protein [Cellulomonas biazotea]|uniref:Uncharacterized protein n=1 Tax=Cellulomonas biazotea TaxID=1709 RepID=A0A402DTX0_9CELL|nr:hypothetical protein [Cellulomonas biazotea]GCE77599.1 hypothetical protein CBZ_26550 [Cellulomonas biazotea]
MPVDPADPTGPAGPVPPVEPVAVTDAAFLAARDRAVARHDGLLTGRFVLVDGELRRTTWRAAAPGWVEVQVHDVPAGTMGELELVREERVALDVLVTPFADHPDGAVLEPRRRQGDQVHTVWRRDKNADRAETIPAGFLWEKNDDYYAGTVPWDDLGPVRYEYRVFPRRTTA